MKNDCEHSRVKGRRRVHLAMVCARAETWTSKRRAGCTPLTSRLLLPDLIFDRKSPCSSPELHLSDSLFRYTTISSEIEHFNRPCTTLRVKPRNFRALHLAPTTNGIREHRGITLSKKVLFPIDFTHANKYRHTSLRHLRQPCNNTYQNRNHARQKIKPFNRHKWRRRVTCTYRPSSTRGIKCRGINMRDLYFQGENYLLWKSQDLSLPRTMISRLAKGVLPPNTSIHKDALLALSKSCTVFVNFLASK